MNIPYKYIVLAVIILFIIYNFFISKPVVEGYKIEDENLNKIVLNTDKLLRNLTDDEAKEMLVSSVALPWVKFMESSEAELLYNLIFNESTIENDFNYDTNISVKKLIENYESFKSVKILDNSIEKLLSSKTNSADVLVKNEIYNKILENLKLTKRLESDESISANEIEEYGAFLGFVIDYDTGSLYIPGKTEIKENILEKNEDKFKILDFLNKYKTYNVTSDSIKEGIGSISDNGSLLPPGDIPNKNIVITEEEINNMDFSKVPNKLKLRVRNNREVVSNALANILNSIAMKKGWNWKKVIKNGLIISDTTISPRNVLNMKVSLVNRISNIVTSEVRRPRQCLKFLSNEKANFAYDILLNLNNTSFNSDEQVLDDNFINYNKQVIYQYPEADASGEIPTEILNDYQNKRITILEHVKLENVFNINKVRFIRRNSLVEQDGLGLPLFLYDSSPENKQKIKITRGFETENGMEESLNTGGLLEETGLVSSGLLRDEEIIYMDNEEKTKVLKVVGSGEDRIYKVWVLNDNTNEMEWKNYVIKNSFEWEIPELEKLGRNEQNINKKFDLVVINNALYDKFYLEKQDNFLTQNKLRSSNKNYDKLRLPIAWRNKYPFIWENNQLEETRVENVILKRMIKDPNDSSKLIPSDNKGTLNEDEFIVGPLDNILVMKSKLGNYTDGSGIIYPTTDVTEVSGKISWKADFLKEAFNNTDETESILKNELALINRLLVIRANTELEKRKKSLPYIPLNNVNKILDNTGNDGNKLTDTEKENVCQELANTLSDYRIILSGSQTEISKNKIKEMNRKNLSSLMENGLQNIERLALRKGTFARSEYPSGEFLLDAQGNKINYLLFSDVVRLQKAIFSSYNEYIDTEDEIPDILYSSYRIQLILISKGDRKGLFILKQINDDNVKKYISETLKLIESIDYSNLDLSLESIENNIVGKGLTLQKINDVYKFINLDDYLSVKLDIINNDGDFNEYYNRVDNIINETRQILKDEKKNDLIKGGTKIEDITYDQLIISDDEILSRYNYENARNLINEAKSRASSMDSLKKLEILKIIRSNIVKRQDSNLHSIDLLSDIISKNVTLETNFEVIKLFHYNSIIIDNNTSAKINETVLETFKNEQSFDMISGYNNSKYYSF